MENAENTSKAVRAHKPYVRSQPKGWKRTHVVQPKEIDVSEIVAEWTNKETAEKVIIASYYCGKTQNPRTGLCYKVVTISPAGKVKSGNEELHSVKAALQVAYTNYMTKPTNEESVKVPVTDGEELTVAA